MGVEYNLKNPGVKRIMQEAKELASESNSYEYTAHPLEDNIFEWHFTVRGPKETPFENGRYHGRILLPNEYPFKPPELIFLTPNGRFELNTKICLSITGFHPEFWQPAWGIRTVLLAVIGFFPTESRGAIGGLDYPPAERKRLAKKSIDWSCPTCHAHNKEALSDIEPAESSTTSEEMPKFEITYKPVQDTEVEKNQEDNQEDNQPSASASASSSSATVSTQKEEEEVPKVVEETPKVVEASSSSSSSSSTTRMQNNHTSLQSSVNSNNNNTTSSSTTSISNGRPPVWLDGLIGALLAFVITLMIKKYIL